MAATFTVAFNSTSKTMTLTITDFDGMAAVDVWYRTALDGTYVQIVSNIPNTQLVTPFYYDVDLSPAITDTGTEEDLFPDGIYYLVVVEYSAVTPIDPNTVEYDPSAAMTTAQIECCITSSISKLVDYDDDCVKDKNLEKLFLMRLLLDGAKYDATSSCGDYDKAQVKLDYVTELCGADDECLSKDC